jgi:hypothetical protein
MAEMYAAALKGVMSNLQGLCKSDNKEKVKTCRRAVEEKVIISEVALSTDVKVHANRLDLESEAQECFDRCRNTGRDAVRECNTLCGNKIIQNLWKRIDIGEFEKIAKKYA